MTCKGENTLLIRFHSLPFYSAKRPFYLFSDLFKKIMHAENNLRLQYVEFEPLESANTDRSIPFAKRNFTTVIRYEYIYIPFIEVLNGPFDIYSAHENKTHRGDGVHCIQKNNGQYVWETASNPRSGKTRTKDIVYFSLPLAGTFSLCVISRMRPADKSVARAMFANLCALETCSSFSNNSLCEQAEAKRADKFRIAADLAVVYLRTMMFARRPARHRRRFDYFSIQ